MPEGFTATAFATGLEHPRRLLVLPNGDVLVAEQSDGHLTLLRDDDGDGKADWIQRHVEGFNGPMASLGATATCWSPTRTASGRCRIGSARCGPARARRQRAADVPPEQRKPTPPLVGEKMITKKGVFGIVQGHANRHLAIDPKSGALFVGVGSSGNIGVEPEVKATIQRFDADGSNQTTFASGLRNRDLARIPSRRRAISTPWCRSATASVTACVPDFLTRVQQGAFYGWPYSYIGQHPQPGFAQLRPDKVKAAIAPDLLFEAHSSAMDIVFYDGDAIPRGVSRRRLCRAERLVEPLRADRLQGRARAVQGRQAAGLLRELHRPASGSLGSTAPKSGAGPRRWPSLKTARC